MSEPDDDLAAAFAALKAPGSTAAYRNRVPSVEAVGAVHARGWPQALAAVLTVVVALAGAGTFLALRNARQQGGAAGAGYPAARLNAAMAFDSSTGRTVMYGGISATGSLLNDTWAWDGTSWSQLSTQSPGALTSPRMSDDPADGGVLLMGLLVPPGYAGSSAGCAVASSGSGTVVPHAIPAHTPAASGNVGTPPPGHGPLNTPSATLPGNPGATEPPAPAITLCPAPTPPPPMQTWLLTANGWHRAASSVGFGADTPSIGSQLALDTTTQEVVAISPGESICAPGGPLRAGGAPQVICPLVGAATQGAAASSAALAPCPVGGKTPTACPAFVRSMSTWTWSRGQWARKGGATIPGVSGGLLFADAGTGHVTLAVENYQGGTCASPPTVPPSAADACPTPTANVATYTWAGSAWSQSSDTDIPPTFALSGGAPVVASAGGHALVLSGGNVYSWSSANPHWVQVTPAVQPGDRVGEAMAEGPGGSIVLFGGTLVEVQPLALPSRLPGSASSSGYVPANGPVIGSDTWTWDGSTWRHVAGALPATPPPATFCPDNDSPKNPCVIPAPVPAIPGAPAPAGSGAAGPAVAPAPASPSPT